MNKNEPILQPNLSKKVEQVFDKVYKSKIFKGDWISALMKTNSTNKEMKELANQMAHSNEEQSEYKKILIR
jgi:hypothetical protein